MSLSSLAVLLLSALLANGAAAQQVRVTLRVIEVPHAQVMKWTGGAPMKGWQLHDEAVKLALAGGAEIVETNLLTVRSGNRAIADSIAEIIYPTEYEPPSGVDATPGGSLGEGNFPYRYTRAFDAAFTSSFETRNTGVNLEIEPTIAAGGRTVDLRVYFEMIERASLTTWTEFRDPWGDASVRMPVFDSKRVTTGVSLADGVFELLNVYNAKPVAVPAVTTRMMVFVRAEVVPVVQKP